MTDPETAALELVRELLGAEPAQGLIRAKCPRCRRWCLRERHRLTVPCYLCTPVDGYGTFADLLLAVEQVLSAAAYQRKIERDGPPWTNPLAWSTPRSKWPKLSPPRTD